MRATEDEGGYFYGTVEQLMQALREVADTFPDIRLVKNPVGNLAIVSADRHYLGYVDLHTGEVVKLGQVPEATNEGRRRFE